MIPKIAEIISKLQPHQEAAVLRLLNSNMVLAHSPGSGKTLTSIAAIDRIGSPATVLTPASLVDNYRKEVKKHTKNAPPIEVMSLPTALSQKYYIPDGNTVVVDEAHALRNSNSARYRYVRDQLKHSGRVMALTGTPAYNQPGDWAPLINLVAGKDILPETTEAFNKKYIETKKYNPGWFARTFLGKKPSTSYKLRNADQLREQLHPYIDIFDVDVEKPTRKDVNIEVTMTPEQSALLDYIRGDSKSSINSRLSDKKHDAKSLNAFRVGERQIANTPEAYLESAESGAKVAKAVEILKNRYKKDKNMRALVYSNFRRSGVDAMAQLLDKEEIPYATFHGGLTQKQKKQIVDRYNSGDLPIILGTGSASEGLDLKKTQLIQILEPHFNEARTDQVIGRGIRYKSHEGLPKNKQNVEVQHFYSVKPTSPLQKLLGKAPEATVDAKLNQYAQEKEHLIQELKRVLS